MFSVKHTCVAVLGALCTTVGATSYQEDFEDGIADYWKPQVKSQWKVIQDNTNNFYYRAKSNTVFSGGMVTTFGAQNFSTLDYSVSLRNLNGGRYATYIIFRATKDFMSTSANGGIYTGSGYAFGFLCVNKVPSFYFFKMQNDVNSLITTWTPILLGTSCGDTHYYRAVAVGKKINLYINQSLVYSYADTTPIKSGRVGLLAYSRTDSITTHSFDEIHVTDTASISSERIYSNNPRFALPRSTEQIDHEGVKQ